jgi:hypothetical protein
MLRRKQIASQAIPTEYGNVLLLQYFERVFKSLSEYLPARQSEQVRELEGEHLKVGHSIDQFLLTFSAAILGLVGSTYTSKDFEGIEYLRIASLTLIFTSLLLSYINLFVASKSFKLSAALHAVMETARNAVPDPNLPTEHVHYKHFQSVLNEIAIQPTLLPLVRLMEKHNALLVVTTCKRIGKPNLVELYAMEFHLILNNLLRNPYSILAARILALSIALQLLGIVAILLYFASPA